LRGLGLLLAAGALLLWVAPRAAAELEIESFATQTTDPSGAPYTRAGGHPYQSVIGFSIRSDESLNGTYLRPPPGFIANPSAVARCSVGALTTGQCPPESRVGVAEITQFGGVESHPLFNLVPERGYPAQFGFATQSRPTLLSVFPRSRVDAYGLTIAAPNLPSDLETSGLVARLCGYGVEGDGAGTPLECQSPSAAGAPFLSNPTDCSTEPAAGIAIDSSEHAGALRELGVPDLSDPDWKTATFLAPPINGCEDPLLIAQFNPSMTVEPVQQQNTGPLQTDQPTGLRLELSFPQSNDPTDPGAEFDPSTPQAPPPKDVSVTLPPGLTISPSAAAGLGACSDQASDPAGDQVDYESTRPVSCPEASKIATATAISPLLGARDPITDEVTGAEPVSGGVYLLKPHPGDLPIGGVADGKFRFLLALENAADGVNVKLPGIATADGATGRLTMHFTDTPQLPVKDLTVSLASGPRAPLATPVTCGQFAITTALVPWSTPGTPDAHPSAGFAISSGPGGEGCPATAAGRPFAPRLDKAGTYDAKAGAASPFALELDRPDGDQELGSLQFTTPPGFAAKLKGVASCPEAAIAAARRLSGSQEQTEPSCPLASRVGTFTAGAGPGPSPYRVQGKAYLAGPYEGAPFSFAFITPALAGAFDLGNIVIRAAAYVDPATAQVTVKTDSLPQILDGIPLRLRSLALTLDRPGFTRNPTSCEPMALSASATADSGSRVALSKYFQAGGCAALPFKPRFSVRLSGALARNGRPALRAAITAKPGQASITRAALTLPVTELLDYDHIRAVCSRSHYASGAGGGERCPPASRYGRARLFTPLLDKPLEGPLYLRANGHEGELPDLIASLNGHIHLDLAAHISSANGLLRVAFDGVPDVPVEKVVLRLYGGRRGLLVNTADLCTAGARASASFLAHNGKRRSSRPAVELSCRESS
jgi:hypothetical protein